ncbi:MAG TPA: hypothetical protein VJZ71_06025 [Phycisphaerae bacterium]|nr:hypothetical protein [Phycisphaerae bacterium]
MFRGYALDSKCFHEVPSMLCERNAHRNVAGIYQAYFHKPCRRGAGQVSEPFA